MTRPTSSITTCTRRPRPSSTCTSTRPSRSPAEACDRGAEGMITVIIVAVVVYLAFHVGAGHTHARYRKARGLALTLLQQLVRGPMPASASLVRGSASAMITRLACGCLGGLKAASSQPGRPPAPSVNRQCRRDVTKPATKENEMSYTSPNAYYQQAAPPRKKRRVFLWVFLAIQVLFIVWIIAGAASGNPGVSSQVTSFCGNHGW